MVLLRTAHAKFDVAPRCTSTKYLVAAAGFQVASAATYWKTKIWVEAILEKNFAKFARRPAHCQIPHQSSRYIT
jgi:hypothetical protein